MYEHLIERSTKSSKSALMLFFRFRLSNCAFRLNFSGTDKVSFSVMAYVMWCQVA